MTDDYRSTWIPSGREWDCTACRGTFRGKPAHVTTQPFRCFCSDECYENAQSDDDEEEEETYDWLTVMDGPGIEGRERIWLGRETSPWEQLDEDGGTRVSAEPVQHIPLPWPMELEEIKDFLN